MRTYKTIILSLAIFLQSSAYAQSEKPAEIVAKVLGISDQNTILIERIDKPNTKINVQLRNLQLTHRNGQCEFERELAEETTKTILSLIDGKHITVRNTKPTLDEHKAEADLFNHDGINIGHHLLYEAVLAHPKDTGTRADWCGKRR
jgi:hypothetical protein